MKLVIFGASGRTGRHLVEQALAAGHKVTAFVRDARKLNIDHPDLGVASGDVRDAQKVEAAVAGCDAVLMALGHNRTSGTEVLSTATDNILAAMRKYGIRRLVDLSGAGVHVEGDPKSAGGSLMKFLLRILAGKLIRDSEEHVRKIRQSGLDYTIVRAPRLVNGPFTGKYRTGIMAMGTGNKVSRADVADYMVKLIDDKKSFGTLPMITN